MYEELKITVVALDKEDIVCASKGGDLNDPDVPDEGWIG